jgi:hypothetical protein
VRAQQQAATPVIGFLSALSISDRLRIIGAFHKGLNEANVQGVQERRG